MSDEIKRAAVSLVERADGRLLCVWNKRYGGWALPGGKVEDGETPEQAQERELLEETGLRTKSRALLFAGEHGIKVESTRGSVAHVFVVEVCPGAPREMEDGCGVGWLTREEFLSTSPFASFYRDKVFPLLPVRE